MNFNEGVACTGRTGGGKSTVLRKISSQLIKNGSGCLWFCVKADEADIAEDIILKAGGKLIRYRPGEDIRFNPLTYEMSRKGGSAVNLSRILRDLHEVVTRSDKGSEDFWEGHFSASLMHGINLIWIAERDDASFEKLYQLLSSVPSTIPPPENFRDQYLYKCLDKAADRVADAAEYRQIEMAKDYFYNQLPASGEKVRGAVLSQVCNTLLPFTLPPLSETMNGVSTLTPESVTKGDCIIADHDVMTYGDHGLSFQLILSFFFLEAVLRRRDTRTPFMFVRDEYQLFAHAGRDIKAQALARSQNFISLSAFQTLPILEDGLGGGIEAQAKAKSLYSCHVNKFILNNNCPQTNEENAKIIGMNRRMFFSSSESREPLQWWDCLGIGGRPTVSMSQQYHFIVPPVTFTTLKTGSEANQFIVEAYVHTGREHFLQTFSQR